MKEEIKYNLTSYLYTENKKQIIIGIAILFLFSCITFLLCFIKIEDCEKKNAYVICKENECQIHFYQEEFWQKEPESVRIKNQKYHIKTIDKQEVKINNEIEIVEEITLSLKNYQGKTNEIIEIEICKSKERMIKKILEMIKGR